MKIWDVIEYLNEDKLLLYKHECQDFNTNSKIIVREGQVAVFIKNGEILDVFKPGRYTLKTENIPLLSKFIRKLTTDGVNSYSAELYFVSTTTQMNLKWGTKSPMDLQDPNYHVIIKVGASGEAMFNICDPIKFIRKVSGTGERLESIDLINFFRSIINTYIKNCISDALVVNKISILNINSCLVTISNNCNEYLNGKIEEFGIKASNFTLETVHISEDDPSVAKLKSILEKKAEMDILGYTYQQERSFDVMDKATSNPAQTGIANSLMGIGLGFGAAPAIAKGINNIADNINTKETPRNESAWNCNCGEKNINSNFCPNCGAKKPITSFWTCPECGKANISSKFCPECGHKHEISIWNCECGETNISSKFCPNCGKSRG